MTLAIDEETVLMLKEVLGPEFDVLVTTYVQDARTKLPTMHAQLQNGDWDGLRRNAHSLKGSSSNLGAATLSGLCDQLEQASGTGELEKAQTLLAQVETEFASVEQSLTQLL